MASGLRARGSLILWASLSALLTLGLVTSLLDAVKLPKWELDQANSNGQRVIIDAVTGVVSSLAGKTSSEFDVATSEEQAAPEEQVPAAPVPAEAAPAEVQMPADMQALRTEPAQTTLPELKAQGSLVPPEAPEITEKLDGLRLPKRGDKGAAPSSLYARPFTLKEGEKAISLVLTEVGFSPALLTQISELPPEVTVVFSPYALDPAPQIALMHKAGFETWGMLPAQGARYPQDDPGPLGLVAGADDAKRLKQVMAATNGAVGLVLPADETLVGTADFDAALKEIDARGLYLLSTHPTRTLEEISKVPEQAHILHRADLVLDSESESFLKAKLEGLPKLAAEQDKLVVVMVARPQSVALLKEWLAAKKLGDGVVLAPLSAMYTPPAPEAPPEEAKAEKKGGGH